MFKVRTAARSFDFYSIGIWYFCYLDDLSASTAGYPEDAQQQPMSMSKTGELNVCAMHGGSLPSFGYAKDASHSVSVCQILRYKGYLPT